MKVRIQNRFSLEFSHCIFDESIILAIQSQVPTHLSQEFWGDEWDYICKDYETSLFNPDFSVYNSAKLFASKKNVFNFRLGPNG